MKATSAISSPRRISQSDLATASLRRELEPRESVDRHGIGVVDAAHVAHGDAGPVSLQQRADTRAEPGQVGAFDGAGDGEDDDCGAEADTKVMTALAAETHRCPTDEFRGALRSYLSKPTNDMTT